MGQNIALIAELQMEAANSKKMLERVPCEKNDFKPHEHSMALGRLATHVAELSGWVTTMMSSDELDLSKREYKPKIAANTAELISILDENTNKAVESLQNATDEDLEKMWTMRNGEKVMFSLPRKVVIRTFAFNHLYHHRGQLSVYLRLLDIHVPGMFGPSYDDQNMAK